MLREIFLKNDTLVHIPEETDQSCRNNLTRVNICRYAIREAK
jgi:hypothetical protein